MVTRKARPFASVSTSIAKLESLEILPLGEDKVDEPRLSNKLADRVRHFTCSSG
jgi:hypothetical protein